MRDGAFDVISTESQMALRYRSSNWHERMVRELVEFSLLKPIYVFVRQQTNNREQGAGGRSGPLESGAFELAS